MITKNLISIFLFLLLASAVPAQTTYSESTEYTPRKGEEKKKKSDKEPPAQIQTPQAAGDVTITIPFSVLDRKGAAIGGIRKEEVSIFVDGTEVPLVAFEQDKAPITMVLVLDSSPSAQVRFKRMQEQASDLVGALPSDMNLMVVDFNSNLNVRSLPTTDRKAARDAISKIAMGDGTSIYSAMKFLYEKILPDVSGRKVIVLMTDGVDTTSQKSNFSESLLEIERHDITIYPIYVDTFNAKNWIPRSNDWIIDELRRKGVLTGTGGTGSSEKEYRRGVDYLNDLAAATGGRVFSSEKLSDGTRSLLGELANRYYATVTVPRKSSGSRRLRVRVNRPSLAVFARGGFVE